MESESDKCVSLRVLYCRQRLSITLRVLIGLELDQAKGRFVPPPAAGIRMMAVLVCILNENRRTRVEARKRPIDAKSCERTVGYQRRLCVPYSNVAWYPSIVMFHSHRTLEPHLRSVLRRNRILIILDMLSAYHTHLSPQAAYLCILSVHHEAMRLLLAELCSLASYCPLLHKLTLSPRLSPHSC